MKGFSFLVSALLAASLGSVAGAQMSREDARSEAEALGDAATTAALPAVLAEGASSEVPGFEGENLELRQYYDNPDGLSGGGEAARFSEPYQIVIDPYRTRFDPSEIGLELAKNIEANPDNFTGGLALGGGDSQCQELPSSGGDLTYEESCNQGDQPYNEDRVCQARLNVVVEGSVEYRHYCFSRFSVPNHPEIAGGCAGFLAAATAQGAQCTKTGQFDVAEICLQGTPDNCTEPDFVVADIYMCEQPVSGWLPAQIDTREIVSETVNETACQSTVSGAQCTLESEICTAPNETRSINGLSITRDCWEWQRSYRCEGVAPANDCGDLEARPECSFSHDECLSENSDGSCNVFDRWYSCTIANAGDTQPPQFVCGGDLYCLDGECTQVERQASSEFKDAMVAVQMMGEVRDNFDPDDVRIFGGENLKCSKKLFGISNCCSGKGVPLITPWLCNAEDRAVDEKDDAGLCHKVGSYCSAKVLGVCVTKKQSYCCFSSKLVRILQQQGREQLGIEWGEPKSPNCEGFLIEEFQRLDLSRMDFSEVYAEFVEAARLPDEVEMTIQIQQRITDYFNNATGGS